MKILHLSDTHIGKDNRATSMKKISDAIVQHYGEEGDIAVVVTGDIVDNGADVLR